MQNNIEAIRQLILEIAPMGVNHDVVLTNDTNIIEEFGIDSVNMITLVVKIEERFGIEVPDDALLVDNFMNINRINDIVSQLLGKCEVI